MYIYQENEIKTAVRNYEDINDRFLEHKKQIKEELTSNLDSFNEDLKDKSQKIAMAMYKMSDIEPAIKEIKSNMTKYEKIDQDHTNRLAELNKKLVLLDNDKVSHTIHNEFKS